MSDIKTFVDVFHTVLQILGLLGGGISATLAWRRRKWLHHKHSIDKRSKDKDWTLTLLYAIAFFFLILFVAVFVKVEYFPNFVITSPHNGQTLVSDSREIEVSGIGAYPGEKVVVIVSDGHTQFEQTGIGIPSKEGIWVVENVVLQTTGYEYSIWAKTEYNSLPILTDNRITAIRVNSSRRFIVIVQTIIPYLMIILICIGGLYFAWRHWDWKT